MAKILVIEDEEAIRENLLELLEAEEFEVISAKDGQMGVEVAQQQLPNLILCDVMMPKLDGHGVLTALRQNPTTATIPFIFLTAKSDKSDFREGMELGADDYLTKPFGRNEVLGAIATRLKKQEIIDQQTEEKLGELRENLSVALPHELRTPLSGILGFSDLILYQLEDLSLPEIREMVEQIKESGERLYKLIQHFLCYAELEIIAKTPEKIQRLRSDRFEEVKELLEEIAIAKAQAGDREADLQLNLEKGSIAISPINFEKLLNELLDNAIKFSPPGSPIMITSTLKKGTYSFSIQNQGRGLTPEQIAQIGAYMQFERKLHEQQGSGLGLAIAKLLTDIHGGKLTLESIPGQFTTVTISLPT